MSSVGKDEFLLIKPDDVASIILTNVSANGMRCSTTQASDFVYVDAVNGLIGQLRGGFIWGRGVIRV